MSWFLGCPVFAGVHSKTLLSIQAFARFTTECAVPKPKKHNFLRKCMAHPGFVPGMFSVRAFFVSFCVFLVFVVQYLQLDLAISHLYVCLLALRLRVVAVDLQVICLGMVFMLRFQNLMDSCIQNL